MPVIRKLDDVGVILVELSKRVYVLEQTITSPSTWYDSDPEFNSVTVDDGTTVTLINRDVDPPTGLSLSTGAFYDNIFIDATWTPPVSGNAVAYYVELAKKDTLLGTYQLVRVDELVGDFNRFDRLEPSTTYGVRVNSINAIGVFTNDPAWTDITTAEDTTVPPAVSGVVLARGATSVIVKWVPLTEVQAPDVALGKGQYEVQVDTSSSFNTGNLRSSTDSSFVRAFSDITASGTWFGRVRAVDASGNAGAWTTATSITAGGVNDSMIIADLSAAKITVGTMSGDRITANTLDVGSIKTSTLVSRDITIGSGGQLIIGSPPTTGIYINNQGIRLYSGGVQMVSLDAVTGAASFKGNIDASTITGSTISGTSISGGTISGGTIDATNTISAGISLNAPVITGGTVVTTGSCSFGDTGVFSLSSSGVVSGSRIVGTDSSGLNEFGGWVQIDNYGGHNPAFSVAGVMTVRSSDGYLAVSSGGIETAGNLTYAGSLIHSSDERIKKNINDWEQDSLGVVRGVRTAEFEWKNQPGVLKGRPKRGKNIGWIAQELPAWAVEASQEGLLGLKLDVMVATLWKAVQQLDSEVQELKSA